MTIEFSCPACQALIRVSAGAAGKRGKCPSCGASILVPQAAPEPAPPPAPAAPEPSPAPAEAVPEPPIPDFASLRRDKPPAEPAADTEMPLISTAPPPAATARRGRRKRSSGGGLLVPLLFGAVLVGFIVWYVLQTQRGLQGTLTADVIADPTVPAGLIGRVDVSVDDAVYERVRSSLESESLRMVSGTRMVNIELSGKSNGLEARALATPGAECFVVKIAGEEKLTDYIADHAQEFNEFRMQQLRTTADDFFRDWDAALQKGEKELPNLQHYRDDLAVASMVSGFGYLIAAWDGHTAHPCVAVGSRGELYFFLPAGITEFTLRGRRVTDDGPLFPGEYVVTVNRPQAPASTPPPAEPEPEDDAEEMTEPDADTAMPADDPDASDKK